MPGSTISLDEFIGELDGMPQVDAAMADRAMHTAAVMAQGEARRQVAGHKPYPVVSEGHLNRSWLVQRIANGSRLENTAPYAAHQEYGTRPFWAPLAPLLDWARRKHRGQQPPERTFGPRPQLGPPASARPTLGMNYSQAVKPLRSRSRDRAAVAKAKAVQQTIARRGIKAKGFYALASAKFPAFVRQALVAELRRAR